MTALGSRADFGIILNQDLPEHEIPELLRHSTFLSAKENTAFIRLFEDKEILMDFLNAVLRRSDEDVITEVEHMNRDFELYFHQVAEAGNCRGRPRKGAGVDGLHQQLRLPRRNPQQRKGRHSRRLRAVAHPQDP